MHQRKKETEFPGPLTPEMMREILELLVQIGNEFTHLAVPILREILGLESGHAPLEKALVARSLRSLWDARYKPETIHYKERGRWSKYITLVVAYLYPAANRLEPPSSLNAIGDLLADEEYLALIMADGDLERAKKIRMTHRDFWKEFILLESSPRDKTGHIRLKTAIRRLKNLLNEHYLALPTHQPPPPPVESEASLPALPTATHLAPFDPAMNPAEMRAWLEARFAPAPPGLRETARKLAQHLAATRLGLISGDDAAVLTRPQVEKTFGNQNNPTSDWETMEFLGRAAILERQLGGDWKFVVAPTVVELLAAEYLTNYEPSRVSLRCGYRGIMGWIMIILMDRGDTQRLKSFVDQLRQALDNASLLSVLEWSHYLGKLQSWPISGIAEYRQQAIKELGRLSQMNPLGLARLQRTIQEARSDLHLEEIETEPAQRAELRLESIKLDSVIPCVDLAACLQNLGAEIPRAPERTWLENRQVLQVLINGLSAGTAVQTRLECAAWLQRSSLSPIVEFDWQVVWEANHVSAAERVAQIVLDANQVGWVRSVAFGVLLREDVLLRLLEAGHTALVYEASLALNKRLFCNSDQWRFA